MKSIDYLPEERLYQLPQKHWIEHEFCFFLHDQMAHLLVQCEGSRAHHFVADTINKALSELKVSKDINLLEFLKEKELSKEYRHVIVSHLVIALTSDMLHFIYEALSCFEKRKFAVGFALLRKPLKENLLFLSWLLADQDEYIFRFEKNTSKNLNGVSPEDRLKILEWAVKKLPVSDLFDATLLNEIIFSKADPDGFEPYWQRASHLVTSQGTLLKTEDLNINFIFNNPLKDDLYSLVYSNLPYVLMFTVQVALANFGKILNLNELTKAHLTLISLGCYEALFLPRKDQDTNKNIFSKLKPFMSCLHCRSAIRRTKKNVLKMYLREEMVCTKCGLPSPIPLYWLFGIANVKITEGVSESILGL